MGRHTLPPLPTELAGLSALAFDTFWSWSHSGDALWQALDRDTWEKTHNPWVILRELTAERLAALTEDADFRSLLRGAVEERRRYLDRPCWFDRERAGGIRGIAYFCMEFGLGEALPLYAGGLGVLAGDYLKTASDLDVPAVGIGLLYQEGYFRQFLDRAGWQHEIYTYNDPDDLPLEPAIAPAGGWLKVPLELPGRTVLLRVWRVTVGRRSLYLLDSNDPRNAPIDRGITAKLYGGGTEVRLLQEMVLGIAGWRVVESLGLDIDVCHLNEGHAAFAVIERARTCMRRTGRSFAHALWIGRAGNVFTTHTPVAAGFDAFAPALMTQYLCGPGGSLEGLGIGARDFLALGRRVPDDDDEPFNMASLAMRGCAVVNGVSRLHESVSRELFAPLFPRWPLDEVPVGHVTNGVHVPSWDSAEADILWTETCGKERWLGATATLTEVIRALGDDALWRLRARERYHLIQVTRERLVRHLRQRGQSPARVGEAERALDPNTLTLGFARRFTEYKRPNLLLWEPERLVRLLTRADRPVQLVVAGKAHPDDAVGKAMVRAWTTFAADPRVRRHVAFLEDYDLALAEHLAQGVDLWINTPRRPWESCGTSGMKVLVNGGLNLSVLDGWWAEGYAPSVGWAIGDGREHPPDHDGDDAAALYRVLEDEVVPAFYDRDSRGLPRAWIARIRASMADLVPRFSANRMLGDYVGGLYGPAAASFAARDGDGGALGEELEAWRQALETHWPQVHFGALEVAAGERGLDFRVAVYLGEIAPDAVRVELYAEPLGDGDAVVIGMRRVDTLPSALNGYLYHAAVATPRSPGDFTPRVVPFHPAARVPLECPLIRWYR